MNKPFKIYAEVLEQEALDQFKDAMNQPFTIKGALMPDAHTGYSLPIGAVVATDSYIVPAWVGYDIGCGMCALKLEGINKEDIVRNQKVIFDLIYKTIPVGFNVNSTLIEYPTDTLTKQGKEIVRAKKYEQALGSLGGGNHFIEVGHDENDEVWVIIHSGSRGVGHGIATHYMKLAHPSGKPLEGHHGFELYSEQGINYLADMSWALGFALANRQEMMIRVVEAITAVLDMSCYELDFSELINRNHNHAQVVLDGSDVREHVVIHRKGATHAEEGMMGVIPGNMRDGSFIVRGKGNTDSLCSSSHGAGRVLGRKEAKRVLNMDDFSKTMEGITARIDEKTLDESPFAYKNIFEVMELQKDLVEIVAHIKPLINIKG